MSSMVKRTGGKHKTQQSTSSMGSGSNLNSKSVMKVAPRLPRLAWLANQASHAEDSYTCAPFINEFRACSLSLGDVC